MITKQIEKIRKKTIPSKIKELSLYDDENEVLQRNRCLSFISEHNDTSQPPMVFL